MARAIAVAQGPEWGVMGAEKAQQFWGEFKAPEGMEADLAATWEKLADVVVDRFEAIAQQAGYTLAWVVESDLVLGDPAVAEAVAPRLADWRRQARDEVRQQWELGQIAAVVRSADVAE